MKEMNATGLRFPIIKICPRTMRGEMKRENAKKPTKQINRRQTKSFTPGNGVGENKSKEIQKEARKLTHKTAWTTVKKRSATRLEKNMY